MISSEGKDSGPFHYPSCYLLSKYFKIKFANDDQGEHSLSMQSEIHSEVCRLNREIAVLRAELATATKRADIVFLESEIGFLSGQASALAETTEFEP